MYQFVYSGGRFRGRCFIIWSRQSDRADLPDTLIKSLVSADPDSFPKIIILLVLGCTLLVTSAWAERSFSVLRVIKNPLRSWIADTMFSVLTLIKIHYSKHMIPQKLQIGSLNNTLDVCSRPAFSTNWSIFTWGNKYFKHHCFFLISMNLETNGESSYQIF